MDDPMYLQPSGRNQLVALGGSPARFSDRGDPLKLLTPRERQVLILIADGKTSKQVAATLGISFKTATCHRTRIMQKLEVHNTALLARAAIRLGLIEA